MAATPLVAGPGGQVPIEGTLQLSAGGGDRAMTDSPTFGFRHVIIDRDGPRNPHIKAAGDIDGDGLVDVVAASSDGGPIVWYRCPGWERHVIAPSGTWSCDAVLVDMDGDGDLDLVISEWYTDNRMEWYENPGPRGSPARGPWQRHIIGSPRGHDIKVGDVDADGALEIVTRAQGGEGNRVVVWKRTGPATWTSRDIPCPVGEGLGLGDLNRDGRLDVVIGGRWYEPPADILRGEWREHVFADWPADAVVALADLNKNGRLDVVLTRSEGPHRLSWFEAPADPTSGAWREHIVDDSVDFAHSLAVCDMDNDGDLDIVTAEMHQSPRKRVMVYINAGDATSWRRHVVAETGSHNLRVADFARTGFPAVVGANWSGPYQPIEMWEQVASAKE
jgi:hypothetical protein